MNPRIKQWHQTKSYSKNPSLAERDYKLALSKIGEGMAMLDSIAKTLNQDFAGRGDIIHGVSASVSGLLEDMKAVTPEVNASIQGKSLNTHRARKYIRLATTKTPDRRTRREVRLRRRAKKSERKA